MYSASCLHSSAVSFSSLIDPLTRNTIVPVGFRLPFREMQEVLYAKMSLVSFLMA